MAKGGGTREVSLPLESTSEEVMEAMKGIFFPDRSPVFGNTDRMTFALGNFRCEEIDHDNFTLVKYITKHKLTKVRLYILSKASSEKFEYQQKDVIPLSDDDSNLMTSAFEDKHGTSQSQLLDSSEDRESLRIQQEREYHECLAIDREKEKEKLNCQMQAIYVQLLFALQRQSCGIKL